MSETKNKTSDQLYGFKTTSRDNKQTCWLLKHQQTHKVPQS